MIELKLIKQYPFFFTGIVQVSSIHITNSSLSIFPCHPYNNALQCLDQVSERLTNSCFFYEKSHAHKELKHLYVSFFAKLFNI